MAFYEYRTNRKNSETSELDVERFGYDIFSYMLSICGFPKAKIPATVREDNIYISDCFVTNVGLSVLPIALYMRDSWKSLFEQKWEMDGFHNSLDAELCLELGSDDLFDEDETLSKIQYSLAFYNEQMLFLDYKGIENYFDRLLKSWIRLCQQLTEQSENVVQMFESSIIMIPEVSEEWIFNFVLDFAIPYGSTTNVSESFSAYTFRNPVDNNSESNENSSREKAGHGDDESVAEAADVLQQNSVPSLPEEIKPRLNRLPIQSDLLTAPGELKVNEENPVLEPTVRTPHTSCFLQQYFRRGKRNRTSPKLEVEDAFDKINLQKKSISPENRVSKQRRRRS